MIFATLLLFALSALNGYASEKKREANCTVVIAADLHFDMPPETDQFHHVLAINALGDHRRIDGVILAGDLFDKSDPKIRLYRYCPWIAHTKTVSQISSCNGTLFKIIV